MWFQMEKDSVKAIETIYSWQIDDRGIKVQLAK